MDPSRIPVVINRAGGTAATLGEALKDKVEAAFAAAGLQADVRPVEGCDVADEVRRLADSPLVVVGGGDGTLGCAAHARVESGGGTFAILPLGTRNHLARELGIPMDLEKAAAVIAAGATRRIDLAEVDGLGFVNNASIGFYPLMVRWRDAERGRRGLPKWLATIRGAWETLKRLPRHRLRLSLERQTVVTPLLFVGNNRYTLERGSIGTREALDDGTLSVFAVAARTRWRMVWFALRTMVGLSDPETDFAALGECAELVVDSRSDHIHIALDGEVHRLKPPLRFRVRPQALTVVVPAEGAPA